MKPAANTMPGHTGRARGGTAPTRPPGQPPRLSGRSGYSMFVGLMKVLLPATAAGLILLVVAWPQLSLEGDRFRLGVSGLLPGQAETLSMLNARYESVDHKDRPYTITADMASQSERDENLIELQLPKADITLKDGTWLALTAKSGRYHREDEMLDLSGAVSLYHDKGFEMRTESARVDLERGTAEGNQPVQGHGAAGTIRAQGFRVFDRGARIVFTGKSHMVLYPGAEEALR